MAVVTGLTCAIADPTVEDLQRAVLIADMLQGRDEFCMTYLNTTARWTGTQQPRPAASKEETSGDDLEALKEAVIHGRRKEAAERTQDALDQGINPQEIINSYLIPALNVVGERFEQKKIFIPEMMMAAKSMQACVDLIKPLMKAEGNQALGTVVLGTVFGDLHDIGKNLVRLLLETSGFRVIDLGENVPPEQFLEAAKKHHAHIVGISSLLTTGDPHVQETVRVIRESELGDRVKIICGGAALTLKFVESSGADAYAKDAADGVKKSKALVGATPSSSG
jgi:5-methyltetrahydrofolate--homocysteine methyltransferase